MEGNEVRKDDGLSVWRCWEVESHSWLLSQDFFFQESKLLRYVYLQCANGWGREVAVTLAWSGGMRRTSSEGRTVQLTPKYLISE